jgi:hypothetical protein
VRSFSHIFFTFSNVLFIFAEPMSELYADIDYEEFYPDETEEAALPVADVPEEPHVPMREQFPPAGSTYLGGSSDGWEYRTVFAGSKLVYTFEMVKQFLAEEGYGDIPLPASADELRLFRRPRGAQLQLFSEHGYIHNPVKILFPQDSRQRNTLILCIYNEKSEGHLLRFHGLARPGGRPAIAPPGDAAGAKGNAG